MLQMEVWDVLATYLDSFAEQSRTSMIECLDISIGFVEVVS